MEATIAGISPRDVPLGGEAGPAMAARIAGVEGSVGVMAGKLQELAGAVDEIRRIVATMYPPPEGVAGSAPAAAPAADPMASGNDPWSTFADRLRQADDNSSNNNNNNNDDDDDNDELRCPGWTTWRLFLYEVRIDN